MNRQGPLTVYLDSSDYSTLSNPRVQTDELSEIRRRLEAAASAGVKFVYSGTHLFEMSPVAPAHTKHATDRAQLLVTLCGRNALISFDRLLASETRRLFHDDAPLVHPLSDDGTWFPAMEQLLSPIAIAQTAQAAFLACINDPSLNGQQRKQLRRRLLGANDEPRPALIKMIKEVGKNEDIAEALQRYPMRPQDMRVLWRYVAGEASHAEAEQAFLEALRDPSWMMRWFANHHSLLSPVAEWVRRSSQEFLDCMRPSIDQAKSLAGHRQSSQRQLLTPVEWKELEDGSVLHAANLMLRQWHPGDPSCTNAALVDERCPGLSTFVRTIHSIVRDALTQQPRALTESDLADALHAMYAPYVRVFRADRYVSPHVQRLTSAHSTRVVSRLRDLPEYLERDSE